MVFGYIRLWKMPAEDQSLHDRIADLQPQGGA